MRNEGARRGALRTGPEEERLLEAQDELLVVVVRLGREIGQWMAGDSEVG